jgi:hypothetical protein
MEELVNNGSGSQQQPQTETPAIEIPQVKTEMTRRGAKKEKDKPVSTAAGKGAPLSDFAKEIVGKLVTFCGTVESGIDTIEGVPMSILQDPNGRWFLKFFSSDGSRAFLYLDQVAAFYTHGENNDPVKQPGESPTGQEGVDGRLQGQGGQYYMPLNNEQFPDGTPNRRSGVLQPGSVRRVPRTPTQGPQQ